MSRRLLAVLSVALASACGGKSDSEPPAPAAPAILVPADGALLGLADVTAGQVAFSGTSPAGAGVTVQVDGVGVCSVTAAAGGTWSCLATVSDGTRVARALATAGSRSTPSPPVTFSLDTARPLPPTIDASVATATNALTVFVTGGAEDGTWVEFYVNGALQMATFAAVPGGAFGVAVPLPGADGPAYVTATAKDAFGNVSDPSPATTVVVDRTPPPLAVLAPVAGARLAAPGAVSFDVVVSGTTDPGAQVGVLLDGVLLATVTAAGDGTWARTTTLTGSAGHVAGARVADAVGNVATATAAFAISFAPTAGIVPASPYPVTVWGQTVADTAGFGEVFPGQANSWVIDADFALAAGWGAQFSKALELHVGALTTPTDHATLVAETPGLVRFPLDQAAAEVTARAPRFGVGDGVLTAVASTGATIGLLPLAGAASGYLNATSDSRLERTLVLDPAQVYTIAWTQEVSLYAGRLAGAAAGPHAPRFQVVLRDPGDGTQLGDPLFVSTVDFVSGPREVSVAGALFAPRAEVLLSFELRGEGPSYAELDALAVTASLDGPVTLVNPGFEGGLDPWVANTGAEAQNLESGPRALTVDPLAGTTLVVTRAVYAPPAASWARVVDVFENPGGAPVTTSVVYATTLGLGGPSLAARSADGAYVVGWEPPPATTSRDVGLVHGNGTAYVSATDRQVFVVHALTVPPGGKAALVHFVVQTGDASGGATAADVPAQTASICADVVAGFPASDAYWRDLAPGVMPIVRNW